MNPMAKTKEEPIEEAENNNRDLGSDLRIPTATDNPSQMTIFYKGSISVFDSITPQRAMAIVLVASAAAANANVPAMSSSPCSQSSVAASPQQQQLQSPQNLVLNVANQLPMARRNSLQHFLEKRRDRLASRSPFIVKNKPENIECQESCAGNEPSTPMSRYVETSKSD